MIIFDRKSKELEIPKALGNVAVEVASGTTDAITRDELRETVSRANERTLAAAERYAAEQAGGAVSIANAYADGVVAESAENTLEQAKEYTDSAITLTDYDYVLRAGANAGDANDFLAWLSKFSEDDSKKVRVLYDNGVFQLQYYDSNSNMVILQGVDATYMFNDILNIGILTIEPDTAPSYVKRSYNLGTFVNSAQTEEIIESADEKFNVVTQAYMQIWDTNIESVNLVFYRVRALIEEAGGWNMYSQSEIGRMHVYFRHDGLLRDFRIAKAEENEITLYWVGTTDDWHHLFDNGVLMMATVVIRWNTQITANDYKEYTFNPVS